MRGSLQILGRVINEPFGRSFLDTASHSMPSRVDETTSVRLSARLSVCLFHRSTAAAACGGFAAGRPAGRKYRSIAGAGAQQQMRAVLC